MANYNIGLADGYPMVEIDSDNEIIDSSDDDIDVILHGTPEQKRKLRKSIGKESSSEDDFEKEMEAELNETIKKLHSVKQENTDPRGSNESSKPKEPQNGSENKPNSNSERAFYEQEYFDSDSDEEMTKSDKLKRKHPVVSNDDLLYDPNMDDDDQKWVDAQRRKYLNKSQGTKKNKPNQPKPLPQSDAVLNCPACMTLLCLDCQRHSTYNNQYRAMFVQNCSVDESERLRFPQEKARKKKKKSKSAHEDMEVAVEGGSADVEGLYNPVRCTVCTTEVGVFDKDDVYHFFNVLSSYT